MIYLYEEKNRLIFFNIYSRGQGGTEMALQRKYNSEFFFLHDLFGFDLCYTDSKSKKLRSAF